MDADVDHVAITAVVMLASTATLPFDGEIGLGVYAGPDGRVLLVSYLGWIVATGLHAIQLPS